MFLKDCANIETCIYNCLRTKTAPPEEDADSPQAELVAEVTNILDTLQVIITRISLNLPKSLRLSMIISRQVLNNHLRRAEATHKKLTVAKCKLEHNISVKITSVNIDANILMNREVNTAVNTQRKSLKWLSLC